MVIAKKYIYVKEFEGPPKPENFKLTEEKLPELKDGEFLVEAVVFSVDPFARLYKISLGDTATGTQVAKIIKSRSNKFPVGKYVVGGFGWRTHSIWKDNIPMDAPEHLVPLTSNGFLVPHLVPFEATDVPLSLALGVLGMPGNSAYFGLLEICKPKAGETVVVSGAAGAVGSHAGQIAKIKGCKVIGIAGSDEKCKWLKSIGFDHTINYKTENVREALSKAAPEGVDCYLDNVGGRISSTVVRQMRDLGRVVIVGSMSTCVADEESDVAPTIQFAILKSCLRIEGLRVNQFLSRWTEGISENLKWIREGKLQYRESVTEGFESLPDVLAGVYRGDNTGKAIVKP